MKITHFLLFLLFFLYVAGASENDFSRRCRSRDIGIKVGFLQPGPGNAITDVSGVRVGHRTVVKGDDVRTGVTVVVPHPGNVFQEKVPAAIYCFNAFGKLAGFTQVEELGNIETPIVLTNTLNVGTCMTALIEYTLEMKGSNRSMRLSGKPMMGS